MREKLNDGEKFWRPLKSGRRCCRPKTEGGELLSWTAPLSSSTLIARCGVPTADDLGESAHLSLGRKHWPGLRLLMLSKKSSRVTDGECEKGGGKGLRWSLRRKAGRQIELSNSAVVAWLKAAQLTVCLR